VSNNGRHMSLNAIKNIIIAAAILVGCNVVGAEKAEVYKLEKLVFEKKRTLKYSYRVYGEFKDRYAEIDFNNMILFEFNDDDIYEYFTNHGLLLKALPHDNNLRLMRYFPVADIDKFLGIISILQEKENIQISRTNFSSFLNCLKENGVSYQLPLSSIKTTYDRKADEKLAERLKDPELALKLAFDDDYWFPERWILNALNFAEEKNYDAIIERINVIFKEQKPGKTSVWKDFQLFKTYARGLYRDNTRFIPYIKKIDYFSHLKHGRMIVPKEHLKNSDKYRLPNDEQASKLYEKARTKGKVDGMVLLEQAANLGNNNALQEIAKSSLEGETAEFNFNRQVAWYKKAAEFGYLWAYEKLGQLYLNAGDYLAAMKYFTQGAQLGCASCYTKIGQMYYDGTGVRKDLVKAFDCFIKGELVSGCDSNEWVQRMEYDHDAQYYDISSLQTNSWSPLSDLLIEEQKSESNSGSLSFANFCSQVSQFFWSGYPNS